MHRGYETWIMHHSFCVKHQIRPRKKVKVCTSQRSKWPELIPDSLAPPDQDGMLVHQREVCRRYPFIHRGKERDKVKWRSLSKETTRRARLNGSRTSRSWVRGINRSATYAYTRRIIKIYSYSIHKTLPSCRLRLRPYICRLCNALIW